jgi:hypothetical protein
MNRITLAVALALLTGAAHAQTVDLVCGGISYTWVEGTNQRMQGPVDAASVVVDFDRNMISTSTPAGAYHIRQMTDASIEFGDGFLVNGHLDRLTGQLSITQSTPEEAAKRRAGQTANMFRFDDLKCSVAKGKL